MNAQGNFKKELIFTIIVILFGGILLSLDKANVTNFIRYPISYSMEPIFITGEGLGKGISSYFKNFVSLRDIVEENERLKIQIAENEIGEASYLEILAENELLKKQLSLKNKGREYVMGNVLKSDGIDYLRIDEGTKSGIQVGDVAVVGNFFVGVVEYVDELGSRIKLPTSNNSYLGVSILKYDESRTLDGYLKNKVISRGVMNGSAEGIKVENITMNSDINDGDIIFVNDSSVGDMLVLGYVVGLSSNPASISRTCFVSTIVDYDTLSKVFVRIN
ncbi:MAG TPA: rod shape-determining protein MreC [Candidatus Dojkabacteria bacterium]|nr:rod shape-determining protein MreC [Candidatus Dojkabacteria bacterium]